MSQWEALLKVYEEVMSFITSMGWKHHEPTRLFSPGPGAAKEAQKKKPNAQLKFLLKSVSATLGALDAEWPHSAVLNGPTCSWMVRCGVCQSF